MNGAGGKRQRTEKKKVKHDAAPLTFLMVLCKAQEAKHRHERFSYDSEQSRHKKHQVTVKSERELHLPQKTVYYFQK